MAAGGVLTQRVNVEREPVTLRSFVAIFWIGVWKWRRNGDRVAHFARWHLRDYERYSRSALRRDTRANQRASYLWSIARRADQRNRQRRCANWFEPERTKLTE